MDGLIVGNSIDKHGGTWASDIVEGIKRVEVRSSNTNKRGNIAIIESGTSNILGTVDLYKTCEVKSSEEWEKVKPYHKLNCSYEEIKKVYKRVWFWGFRNNYKFNVPEKCANRKKGQVIWVKDAM